ncbi:MAG: alpha/beta hydrolase [Sphaerochaetaceae bacterium]|nr:alpha/beta hydrolase [Sphaerochaetaceae bacterium]
MSIFKINGKEIFYDLAGEETKPKIVILNGIMMSTRSWTPFMNTLTEHFQVLRMDFFDQGQSSKLPGQSYTHDLQIDTLKALLDYLNIKKINVIGISYGGNAALAFTCKYQEYVERVMLFNSTAYTTPWLKDIGDGWNLAGRTRNPELYYKIAIPVIYSEKYYGEKIEWMRAREKVLAPIFSDPDWLDGMERLTISAEPYDVRNKLKNITVPVMIISAEQDTLTPVQDQEYLYKNIKNSNWIKLPDVGHASMYENPLIFTSLITGFFLVKDTEYTI